MACSAAVCVPREPGEPSPSAAEIVVARLDGGPLQARKAVSLLSDAERDRAARFVVERERRRFILARVALRRLLGERLGVSPGAVQLTAGKHGKPALAWPFSASGLRFNVSHSEDLAAYGFACGREVGIDIEAVRGMNDAECIARRFFSTTEYSAYLALDPVDREVGFFRCWTRKEAFVKAIGDGLTHRLDNFDVSLAPGEPARLLRVGNAPGDGSGWSLHAFDPAPGFVGAIVVQAT